MGGPKCQCPGVYHSIEDILTPHGDVIAGFAFFKAENEPRKGRLQVFDFGSCAFACASGSARCNWGNAYSNFSAVDCSISRGNM